MKTSIFFKVALRNSLLIAGIIFSSMAFSQRDYIKEWEEIEMLRSEGRTASALEKTEALMNSAKKTGDEDQRIKALIVKMALKEMKEEDSFINSLKEIEQEIENASPPAKSILHSAAGEMFQWYYSANQYKISERTEILDFDDDNIETWTAKHIVEKASEHYDLSLSSSDILKKTPAKAFELIWMNEEKGRELRPTLFDILLNRARSFYEDRYVNLTNVKDPFYVDSKLYFSPSKEFIQIPLEEDELSFERRTLQLYQQAMAFHYSVKNIDAMLYYDLLRLKYVHSNYKKPDCDSLYIDALNGIISSYAKSEISTEAIYSLAYYYYREGDRYNQEGGQYLIEKGIAHRWMKKRAMELCNMGMKRHPNSRGADMCSNLAENIREPQYSIDIEHVNKANEDIRFSLKYRNVKKMYFRVVNNNENILVEKASEYKNQDIYYFLEKKAIKEWSVILPDSGDFQSHRIELDFMGFDNGYYTLISSIDPNFKTNDNILTQSSFWVSDIGFFLIQNEKNGPRIFTLNRNNGRPEKGVTLTLYKEQYNYTLLANDLIKVNEFISDSQGKISLPRSTKNENYRILLSRDGDSIMIGNPLYVAKEVKNKEGKINYKTALFTDRKIYRPGQIVYFKGLVMEFENRIDVSISPDKEFTLKLMDANRQEVSRVDVKSNEYGTFQGSFILPSSALTGRFYLNDGVQNHPIQVEEYKRPSFEIKFDLVKENYRLGDTIVLTGQALSYNGVPLSNAKGSMHIIRNIRYSKYSFAPNYYHPGNKEIVNGVFKTDERGKFEFSFLAIPDENAPKESLPIFVFNAEAVVTDVNGETQLDEINIPIGYHSLEIEAVFTGTIEKNTFNGARIQSQNLSGVHTPTEIEVSLIPLEPLSESPQLHYWELPDYYLNQEEHQENLKNNYFTDDGSVYNRWTLGDTVYTSRIQTNDSSRLGKEVFKKVAPGAYKVHLSTTDPNGQKVEWSDKVVVYDKESQVMPLPLGFWSNLTTAQVKVGEEIEVSLGSIHKDAKVYYALSNKNGTFKEEWLDLKGKLSKLEIPVREEDRGQYVIELGLIYKGLIYQYMHRINVPLDNKKLSVKLETFRKDLRPGDTETWKISIRDFEDKPVDAEVLVSMYDRSLDTYVGPLEWNFSPYNWNVIRTNWNYGDNYRNSYTKIIPFLQRDFKHIEQRRFDQLNWQGFFYRYDLRRYMSIAPGAAMEDGEMLMDDSPSSEEALARSPKVLNKWSDAAVAEENGIRKESLRSNFKETAFFYPDLRTNEDGNSEFSFVVPDALTKWKLQILATTKDLKYGGQTEDFITKKELMVVSNYPRFISVGDTILFSSKVSNLTNEEAATLVEIRLTDPISGKNLSHLVKKDLEQKALIPANGSQVVRWKVISPQYSGVLEITVFAKTKNHRDGEAKSIPVLKKAVLVTESYPISLRGGQKKEVLVKHLGEINQNTGIEPMNLSLEFTPNPVWYVVQALPYLDEINNESTTQKFNRYYSNAIAYHIANSNEKIKNVFEAWKMMGGESFSSKLEKNQDLKNIILSESPWLNDAIKEEEDKRKIGLFFDENNMKRNLTSSLFELLQSQSPNGSWPWFEGMKDNRAVCQNIVLGMGRLRKLGIEDIENNQNLWSAIQLAVQYLDNRMYQDYQEHVLKDSKREERQPGNFQIQYLFARSYFKDIHLQDKYIEAYSYYMNQSKKFWLSQNKYLQSMIALTFYREGDKIFAEKIILSLRENAIHKDELGMYWKNENGYYWYQSDIAKQAMIIEAFDEITDDAQAIDEMRIWLLKQKQTRMWRTGKATTEACYAMLLRGTDLLSNSNTIDIKVGKEEFKLPAEEGSEAGSSYIRLDWKKDEIQEEMKNISAKNEGESVAWGAVYYQYFQDSDQIEKSATSLSVNRELYVRRYNNEGEILNKIEGNELLETGDIIVVRTIIKSDRDLEFVHMKDMRAAGLEPISNVSGYKWKGGLGYYLSIRDASTNYYFDYLQRGTYVLEYELKASNSGNFTMGISTLQSFYAPEFSAHSKGQRIEIH